MSQSKPMYNSFAAVYPELSVEWHPTKNNGLEPQMVAPKSRSKVWWLGPCGHEWQAKVCNRANGTGCPICSGNMVLSGFNDLATVAPELAEEWHPTKNEGVSPATVTSRSNKTVMWQCTKGHEWAAMINNRYRFRQGCPYCSGRKAIPGETDLATTNPELAAEWHPTRNGNITPKMVKAGSSERRYWWIGKCGHEWQANVSNRTYGTGCPICAGKIVLSGFNDLATTHPELATEWHPEKNRELTPQQVVAGSSKAVWWICRKGHEWSATVNHRSAGTGCPKCANELQTSFPEQAILYYFKKIMSAENRYTEFGKEIDVWLPDLYAGIEYNGYWHRTNQEADAKKIAFFAERNIRILTVKEGEKEQIVGDTIEYRYSPNKDSLDWAIGSLFQLLHLTSPHIDSDEDSSEIYAQYIELEKQNSLAVKYPHIASEWHPERNGKLKPENISAHSDKKFWWLCSKCGYEWKTNPLHRSQGTRCPVCTNQKVKVGYNDLATTNPNLAAEWHPTKNGELTPQMVTAGSSRKKVWWECPTCGHEWQVGVAYRSQGRGCPVCYLKRTRNHSKEI